jgi:hypothetical protein
MTPPYQGTYNLPSIARGDTAAAWSFTVAYDGVPAVLSSARGQIRTAVGALVVDMPITAAANTVTIAAMPPATTRGFPVGVHNYDIEVTRSDGLTRSYLTGTFTVTSDRTY